MRFNKIIHPEIVLDRRGPSELRSFYRLKFKEVESNPTKDFGHDPFTSHLLIAYLFKHRAGKVYHASTSFLNALKKINKDMPIKFIPDNLNLYFNFGENIISDLGKQVIGAYVYSKKIDNVKDNFCVSFISEDYEICNFLCDTKNGGPNVSDLIRGMEKYKEDNKLNNKNDKLRHLSDDRKNIFRLIVNLCIYLNSEGADLLNLPPMINESKTQKNKYELKHKHVNECTLPITLLNHNFHERIYNIDSTWVESFPRWQPCGTGRNSVKLIWVKSHERHYQND